MGYTKRGPWADGDPGAFDSDDLNAMDEAVARLGGGGVVDLGSIAGPVTIDMDSGGVFRATLAGDAAFTFTNASLPSRRRAARLMLSTQGYVPTFPGSVAPSGGLSGDYVGAVDQFDIETAPGHSTPMVQHVAEYGRYRPAFIAFRAGTTWTSDDGVTWDVSTPPQGFPTGAGLGAFSPTAKVFVWAGALAYPATTFGINTSRNGHDWTRQAFTATTSSSTGPTLIWNEKSKKFNLHVSNTTMYESVDGVTWTAQALTGLRSLLKSYAWSESLGIFAGFTGEQYRYTSTDGLNWNSSALISEQTDLVHWVDTWGMFVTTGNTYVLTSPNGTTWTVRKSLPMGYTIRSSATDGSMVLYPENPVSGGDHFSYMVNATTVQAQASWPLRLVDAHAIVKWNWRIKTWVSLFTDKEFWASHDGLTWLDPVSAVAPGGYAAEAIVVGD